MGQAKLKKVVTAPLAVIKAHEAVKTWVMNENPPRGMCYVRALIAKQALVDLGVESRLVFGYSLWRFGRGYADMNAIHPVATHVMSGQIYHVWLEIDDKIFDPYCDFETDAKALQDADGIKTTATWIPPYLYLNKSDIATVAIVRDESAGYRKSHYDEWPQEKQEKMENIIIKSVKTKVREGDFQLPLKISKRVSALTTSAS